MESCFTARDVLVVVLPLALLSGASVWIFALWQYLCLIHFVLVLFEIEAKRWIIKIATFAERAVLELLLWRRDFSRWDLRTWNWFFVSFLNLNGLIQVQNSCLFDVVAIHMLLCYYGLSWIEKCFPALEALRRHLMRPSAETVRNRAYSFIVQVILSPPLASGIRHLVNIVSLNHMLGWLRLAEAMKAMLIHISLWCVLLPLLRAFGVLLLLLILGDFRRCIRWDRGLSFSILMPIHWWCSTLIYLIDDDFLKLHVFHFLHLRELLVLMQLLLKQVLFLIIFNFLLILQHLHLSGFGIGFESYALLQAVAIVPLVMAFSLVLRMIWAQNLGILAQISWCVAYEWFWWPLLLMSWWILRTYDMMWLLSKLEHSQELQNMLTSDVK